MARPFIQAGFAGTSVKFPQIEELRARLRDMPKNIQRKYLRSAVRKSLEPGLAAMKQTTPKGPTGNLRRAIASKVITYPSGNAVGLNGFVAAGSGKNRSAGGGSVRKGKDLAYHAGLVEFGTKDRRTKGSIASSYNRLGPFKLHTNATRKAGVRLMAQARVLSRRAGRQPLIQQGFEAATLRQVAAFKVRQAQSKFAAAGAVRTTPAYPRAFFKRAPAGERVFLGSMPKGGSSGEPPIKTAFDRSRNRMSQEFQMQMARAVDNAARDMRWRQRKGLL